MYKLLVSQRQGIDSYGSDIDILEGAYTRFFNELGCCLIPISNSCVMVEKIMNSISFDAVVLTGGGDIPLEMYSKAPVVFTEQDKRDEVEKMLISKALEMDKPILGICRGMQFVLGYFGGKVVGMSGNRIFRQNGEEHIVEIMQNQVSVNNFHNYGILEPLPIDFIVLARDRENDTVEAVYSETKKILGVQWHPERPISDPYSKELVKKLIIGFIRGGSIK